MSPDHTQFPYQDLVAIAERLFDACEDDVRCISRMIETLDPASRNELLVSDLLNAFQAFYYFFRTIPDELTQERLELEPASSLIRGIKLDEVDLLELIFSVQDKKPVIVISDGEHPLVTYEGKSAYADGMKYIENPPY
jgi:hypothetical protein